MSSITTAVPSGILPDWCLGDAWDLYGDTARCGNGTQADYWSVCCDGEIVNVNRNIWRVPRNMTMDELVCCRHIGSLEGGLHPLPTGPPWTCDVGAKGTPLVSLAATNVHNAGAFVATYASANYEFGYPPTDMLWTETPQCLWVSTKMAGPGGMSAVTVPAATFPKLSTTSFLFTHGEETATEATTPLFTHTTSTRRRPTETNDPDSSITEAPVPTRTRGAASSHTKSSGSTRNSFRNLSLYSTAFSLITASLIGVVL